MTINTTRLWAGRVSSCAALALSIPALAQESGEERSGPIRLEEVVVTATKRTESLQDVPVAVTALTSQDIEVRGLHELQRLREQRSEHVHAGPGARRLNRRSTFAAWWPRAAPVSR